MGRMSATAAVWVAMVASTGCAAGSGTYGGLGDNSSYAASSATSYEVHLNSQMNWAERNFRNGRMSEYEYEIRLDQIRRNSLLPY